MQVSGATHCVGDWSTKSQYVLNELKRRRNPKEALSDTLMEMLHCFSDTFVHTFAHIGIFFSLQHTTASRINSINSENDETYCVLQVMWVFNVGY